MRFVLAGVSGFLGTAWRDHLAREGHEVVRLVRGEALSASESRWDPYAGHVDRQLVESADVVGTLSGAPLAHWPWTASYKRTFTESRVASTRTLAEAVAASDRKPAFVAQNGIAGYGDRGDAPLTEESAFDADTFMGRVTRAWQDATTPAAEAGARTVVMRTGVVLDRRGGAMKPLLPLFKAGLGGPVGDGSQYFSTISMPDWIRAATHLAVDDDASGVYNVSAPNATTNAEFGKELGRMLHRPSVLPAPSWAIRKVVGDVSSELLNSTRVEPARLLEEGFAFEHPTLNERLAAALT
jgi:uncharacterized protein (TIGR01777 family)